MRKRFFELLADYMERDPRIWLLVGDLGYGVTNPVQERFRDRFVNVGVAEHLLVGAAVGLTYEGKIPVVYSISSFLIRRPFEAIALYGNHENAPIKLAGSGRGADYAREGHTHWAHDIKSILDTLPHIRQHYPDTETDLTSDLMTSFLYDAQPSFLSLRK